MDAQRHRGSIPRVVKVLGALNADYVIHARLPAAIFPTVGYRATFITDFT